ncbi:MAG: DUF6265 family protein [Sphingomonadales bacterium]|nr:DUF6265 family protein [Sphingomonadales bacterium]
MKHATTKLIAILLFAPALGLAQDKVSIDDFAFLTGYWKGTGLGGEVEEVWMPPVDGRMFGIFKLSGDGELSFTEYMEITQQEGQWVVRLKHFNPDFSGWEEKDDHVTFHLDSVRENEALFGGLTYKVSNGNELEVTVRLNYSDGRTVVEPLNFVRQSLQAAAR